MGLIHVYNSLDITHTSYNANGKIKDVFAEYKNYIAIKEGCKVSPDYEITENDIIFLRKVPKGAETIGVISIVSAVVALGVGIGSTIYAKRQNAKMLEEYEKQQELASDKANKINVLPFLKGAPNTLSLGKTIPYIMGSTYLAPYLINGGFYSIGGTDGKKQYWNAILCAGYNNQKLQSVSIGNNIIKEFDQEETEQAGTYDIYHELYGNIVLEVEHTGEMYANGLSQKVVSEVYGDEIKHDFGQEAEPVIKQLPENVQQVEICIKLDGLRQYGENGWENRSVEIIPYWSNNPDAATPTWHAMNFKVNSTTYSWQTLDAQGIAQAKADGVLTELSKRISVGREIWEDVLYYVSNSDEIEVTCNSLYPSSWTIKRQIATSQEGNKITRNTNETIRFVCSKNFTPSESYNKKIAIKLEKTTPTLEDNNAQDKVVLQYINTWCYDNKKSTSAKLEPCRPVEQPFRDQTTRLALKIEASANTENILDEINIMTTGTARIFTNGVLSETKEPTRNPVAVILELLTSEFHRPSMFSLEEIDTSSFNTAYVYCEENNFYCDGVITSGIKKRDQIEKILGTIGASLVIGSDGLLEIAIDKEENTPVALLNAQSVKSIRYAKTFERKITGLKTTYTNRNTWKIETEYFMRNGTTEYDQLTDTLGELGLDTVTTHDHAYKVAQRQQRQTILQPRTIEVDVGLEGELYPLYSTIMLQMEQLKQGLCSSVVHGTIEQDGYIVGLEIADEVEFVDGLRYGVIIQAQNDNGKRLIYDEVTGSGKTHELTLTTPILAAGVLPDYQNELSFGLLDDNGEFEKITNVMKIYGITPSNNHGWTLTLKDYNEEIYQTGVIPEYKSNLTTRATSQINLPTVTQGDVDAVLFEANKYTKETAEGLSRRIDGIVTDVTTCALDVTSAIFDIGGDNQTIGVQEVETNVILKQGENYLPFQVGEIDLPSGWSYRVVDRKIIFTVGNGTVLKTGQFRIPIQYREVISQQKYVDENGAVYVDENGAPYYAVEYANTYTQWDLYFTYFGSGNPVFLGTFSNISDIPENVNVGDYFVWGGTNRQPTTLTPEGYFLQARLYKYEGTMTTYSWNADTDTGHGQIALSNVLAIANADLEHNNSTVYEYLDHLTSNSAYVDFLVANDAFINKLAAQIITADLVTTDELEANYTKTQDLTASLIKVGSNTLVDELADINTDIGNRATTTALNNVINGATAIDIKNSKVNGNTLIQGGYIKTEFIDVDTILGNNAVFRGTIQVGDYSATTSKGAKLYTANGDGYLDVTNLRANSITNRVKDINGVRHFGIYTERLFFNGIIAHDTIKKWNWKNSQTIDAAYLLLEGICNRAGEGQYIQPLSCSFDYSYLGNTVHVTGKVIKFIKMQGLTSQGDKIMATLYSELGISVDRYAVDLNSHIICRSDFEGNLLTTNPVTAFSTVIV